MMKRLHRLPFLVCMAALPPLLLVRTAAVSVAVRDALYLCAAALLPSLFPLSVTAQLLLAVQARLPASRRLEAPMRALFGLPGCAALPLLLGTLGGFPLGAQCAAAQYERGALSEDEAERLCALSSNAGPAFLCGAVGPVLFGSVQLGMLLWLVQLAAAFAVSLAQPRPRQAVSRALPAPPCKAAAALPLAVRRSTEAMLLVCGFVCFFAALLALPAPLLAQLPADAGAVFAGVLELTNGVFRLAPVDPAPRFVLASALLAWGGACVQLQSVSFLTQAGLPARPFLRSKAAQAAFALPLSALIAALIWRGAGARLLSPAFFGLCLLAVFFLFFRQNAGKTRRRLL